MTSKYRHKCSYDRCESARRDGDIFCHPHYFALPPHLRQPLYSYDPKTVKAGIEAAEQWLEDKDNNALIVKEEGP